MKNKLLLLILLLAVLTLGARFSTPTYEYKFEYSPSEKKANQLGMEGWELVAIQGTGPGLGNNVPTYVFKRAK